MSQFVQWWHENPDKADEIRANRRKKLKDPVAAEAHRQRCKEYYARTKQASDKTRGLNKPKSFWINGIPVEYLGVGQTCQLLQISASTLRNWEEREIIPVDAKIVDAIKRRWWPAGFVRQLQPIVQTYQEGRIPSLGSLRAGVLTLWQTYKRNEGIHEHRAGSEGRLYDDPCEQDGQVVGEG